MFFIFNKQKIYSYLIAASTVVILFIVSIFFAKTNMETMETVSNTEIRNFVNNNINNEVVSNTTNNIKNYINVNNIANTMNITNIME